MDYLLTESYKFVAFVQLHFIGMFDMAQIPRSDISVNAVLEMCEQYSFYKACTDSVFALYAPSSTLCWQKHADLSVCQSALLASAGWHDRPKG